MRRFLSFLTDSRTLSILGAIVLAAFLLLGAEVLEIGLIWAAAVFGVLLLIWLLIWAVRRLRKRAAARKFNEVLEKETEAAAAKESKTIDPSRKAEVEELRSRMVEAVKTIKSSKIGQMSGRDALYELPWYMVIGNPSAGKSTAILNSGLQFPFADKGNAIIQGIGGTRNCDWFFSTDGIVLDTAGRYSVEQDQRQEWLGFLSLLKKYRPKAPINGIVVTASIPELMSNSPQFAINLAKNLRERVQELTERLEIFAPVYVMFTKADLITGFVDFFGDNDKVERDRVWGASLPYEPDEKQDVMALFDKRFDELYAGLKEISVAKMAAQRHATPSPELMIFPLEFAGTKPTLRTFLATLFEVNPYQFKPIFRGFYFTSAVQASTVRSLSTERIAARFGLTLTDSSDSTKEIHSQNGFFLRDLFSKVVFADRKTVRQFASPAKVRLRYISFSSFVVVLALLFGGWTWSYLGNRQLTENVQADLQKVVKLQANNTGLQARFEALGILQDRIEQLHKFRDDRPLALSLGLYQGNRLEDKLVAEYYTGLKQLMLAPVSENLQAFLQQVNAQPELLKQTSPTSEATAPATADQSPTPSAVSAGADGLYTRASPTDAQDAYNALKTYLMLSDKRRVEAAHLTDQISRFWRGWLEANRGDMSRQEVIRDAERTISFYLSRVNDDNWPTLSDSNLALIEQTRDSLRSVVRGMPARERVYAEIKARASTRFAPMTVTSILGTAEGETDSVVAGSSMVSGAFTKEAWQQYVDQAIRDAANKETSTRDWVLDVAANDDLTLEGSPEQIRKTLVTMYKTEYAKEWSHFLQGVAVRDLGGFDQAVNAMNQLGDPQNSPIRKVLETVYEQTSWDNPSLVNAGLQKARTGFVNWVKNLFSRAKPSRLDVNLNVNANNAGEIPVGPIGKEFAGVGRIVMERDNNSLLRGYLGNLSKLRTRFNQIKNQGDPGPGALQLMQQTLEGNGSELAETLKYVDEQMLTGMDASQRQALRPLLVRPLIQAYAAIIQPTAIELNKVWNAQVYQLFQQSLATKYPFAATAKMEAAPNEIAQVFGPEGAVSKFITSAMGSLIIRRGDLLSPRAWADQGLTLKPDFVTSFPQWVAPLSGAAVAGTSQPQTLFQILPQPVSGLTEYLIEIDGQQLRYRNTPPQWTNFVWPNAQGTPGSKILATTFDGRTVELINEPGNFGLERLLNTAQRTRQPDGSFELTWARDGTSVSVRLRVVQSAQTNASNESPQGKGLRGTVLPSSVVEINVPNPPAGAENAGTGAAAAATTATATAGDVK
ncbi:MAG: type VI secretion system membrane subunit TssM [Burkholderiaceae bacterium]|jgi:type VI secretion system protein ImpL|nr:type VI secretion system membrane subunit TssM [Burkholderiaceae bacterium]